MHQDLLCGWGDIVVNWAERGIGSFEELGQAQAQTELSCNKARLVLISRSVCITYSLPCCWSVSHGFESTESVGRSGKCEAGDVGHVRVSAAVSHSHPSNGC